MRKKIIDVIPIDTEVVFGPKENRKVTGHITSITITKNSISYEITFWEKNDLKSIWLEPEYFDISKKVSMTKLGFDVK